MINVNAGTLDTTNDNVMQLTAQWGTAAPGNSLTLTNFLIEAF